MSSSLPAVGQHIPAVIAFLYVKSRISCSRGLWLGKLLLLSANLQKVNQNLNQILRIETQFFNSQLWILKTLSPPVLAMFFFLFFSDLLCEMAKWNRVTDVIVRIIKPPVNFYQKIQIIRVPTSFPAPMILVKTVCAKNTWVTVDFVQCSQCG